MPMNLLVNWLVQ